MLYTKTTNKADSRRYPPQSGSLLCPTTRQALLKEIEMILVATVFLAVAVILLLLCLFVLWRLFQPQ